MNSTKAPSSAQSEVSLADDEPEAETNDANQIDVPTPSPPLSPAASDISEPQTTLVNQTQEPTWREVAVTGGE